MVLSGTCSSSEPTLAQARSRGELFNLESFYWEQYRSGLMKKIQCQIFIEFNINFYLRIL